MINLLASPLPLLLSGFVTRHSHGGDRTPPWGAPVPTLAATLRATTTSWLIDGNNLLGARGISKDLDMVQERLGQIQLRRGNAYVEVLLVLDGPKVTAARPEKTSLDSPVTVSIVGACQRIQLSPGYSADDYIYHTVASQSSSKTLHVVTADRELRRRVRSIKPTAIKDAINPVRFWKTYLPRLIGSKGQGRVEEAYP